LHSGVSLFFVLSGFLIYFRHSGPDSLHRGPLIRYFFHRFARIFPMYFIVVVGTALWTWRVSPHYYPGRQAISDILLQLTFVRGFSDQFKFVGVAQGWTLTTEATFYVLFPLLLLMIRRFGFLAVLAACWAAGLLLYSLGEVVQYHDFFRPFIFVELYTFFGRAAEFFVGMMLADYVRRAGVLEKGSTNPAAPEVKRRLPFYTLSGVAGIVLCLSALAHLELTESLDGPAAPLGGVIYLLIQPLFIGAFFYGLITERTWFSWILGSRLLVTMGASSYCFYLIHVGGPFSIIRRLVIDAGPFEGYLALVAISILMWGLLEEPLRRLILSHRLFRHGSLKTAPAPLEAA
jgi:peptidoglycan/LPS O-acetylase OafA/YrhL